jgi:DNA-binding NtrC family response regulator
VFPIHLPTLKQRLDDVPLLARHFVQKYNNLSAGRVKDLAPVVVSSLASYSWPGNIRELENVLKRALIKTEGETITAVEIPGLAPPVSTPHVSPSGISPGTPFKEYVKKIVGDAESKYLVAMLEQNQGNVKLVAELMDLDRKTIYKKIEDYGIDLAEFRGEETSP